MTRSDLRRLLAIIVLTSIVPAADLLRTVSALSAGLPLTDAKAASGLFSGQPGTEGPPIAAAGGSGGMFDLAALPHPQSAASTRPTPRPIAAVIRILRPRVWISRS